MNGEGAPATVRLKFLTSKVGSGKTPLGGSQVYQDSGVLFIRSQNVHDDGLRLDDAVFISEEIDEEMAISRVQAGDVLLNITGASIGRVCAVPPGTQRANVNQHVCIIRPRSCTDSRFLAYSLQSGFGRSQVFASEVGVSREGLTFEQAGNIQIPAALHKQQTRIASFLDAKLGRLDELMRKKERQLGLLAEKRQALISHAVTRGLNHKAKLKSSGLSWLGSIPEQATPKRLKYLLTKVEQGWSPQCENRVAEESEWGVLKVGCVNGTEFDENENKALPSYETPLPELEVESGDILVSRANTTELLGSAALVKNIRPRLLLCDKLFRLTVRQRVDRRFLTYSLASDSVRYQFERDATGASSSMKNIGQDTLRNAFVIEFTPEQQTEIADFLDGATSRLERTRQRIADQLTKLHEYRQALITAAITGQVAIPEEAA